MKKLFVITLVVLCVVGTTLIFCTPKTANAGGIWPPKMTGIITDVTFNFPNPGHCGMTLVKFKDGRICSFRGIYYGTFYLNKVNKIYYYRHCVKEDPASVYANIIIKIEHLKQK